MTKHPSKNGVVFLCTLAAVLWITACVPVSAQSVTAVAFNRYYLLSPAAAQVHFYSTDTTAPQNWKFEGVEGYVSPAPRAYTVPLHRWYSDYYWDHLYTTSETEASNLPAGWGFKYEMVAGYVVLKDREIPGTVPLYRFTRQHSSDDRTAPYQDHFYSLSPKVPADYIAEGVCCRVWKDPVQLPDALLKISDPAPNRRWNKGDAETIRWMVWTGGGFMRLSYSTNGGQSWIRLTDVRVPRNDGVMSDGSYSWHLPPSLAGTIALKLDWVATPGASPIPWASAQVGNIVIAPVVPGIRIRK